MLYFLRPMDQMGYNLYADADLTGIWCREYVDQVGSVLSITWYIIIFENFPIIWVSKMQTDIDLSTTEYEYISLSQSMSDYIILRHIMLEVSSVLGMKCNLCNSYTTTFEENKGTIRFCKRTKIQTSYKIFLHKIASF